MTLTSPEVLWLWVPIAAGLVALAASDRRKGRPAYCRWGSLTVKLLMSAAIVAVMAGPVETGPRPAALVPPNASQRAVYLDPRPWHPPAPVADELQRLASTGASNGILHAFVRLPETLAKISVPAVPVPTSPSAAIRATAGSTSAAPPVWPWTLPKSWPHVPAALAPAPVNGSGSASASGQSSSLASRVAVPASVDVTAFDAPMAHFGADWPAIREFFTTTGPRTLHIFAEAPPTPAHREQLAAAGISWQFHPLPVPHTEAGAVLGQLETVPAHPEEGFPFRVRVPVLGALREPMQWRVTIGDTPGDWRPIAPTASQAGRLWLESGAYELTAGAYPVTVEVAPIAGTLPSPFTGLSPAPATPTMIAKRGIEIRPAPRWFVLPGQTAAETAGARWMAESAAAADVPVDVTAIFPNLLEYSGAVIPLPRLARLSDAELRALRLFVEFGGGLIVPCHAPTTPLDERELARLRGLLPVKLGDPSREASAAQSVREHEFEGDVARASVVFIIDNSGSMNASVGAGTRSQYVRAAVKAAIRSLEAKDRVAVAFFSDRVRGQLGPYPATDENIERLIGEIDRYFGPEGMTSIVRACDAARDILASETAAIRHVVLLSDGEDTVTPLYDFPSLRRAFLAEGISCSVIGIGEYDDKTLRNIHTPGNGTMYFADRTANADYYRLKIPQMFVREVRAAQERGDRLPPEVREGRLPEQPMSARRGLHRVTKEAPFLEYVRAVAQFPPVLGMATLEPLPRAMPVLSAHLDPSAAENFGADFDPNADPQPTPILVTWRVGLGEVAALAPALSPESLPDWFQWPESSAFVGAWLRAMANARPGLFSLANPRWALNPAAGDKWEFTGTIVPVYGDEPGRGWKLEVDAIAPFVRRERVPRPGDPVGPRGPEGNLPPPHEMLFDAALASDGQISLAVDRRILRDFSALEVRVIRMGVDGEPDPTVPVMVVHRELLPPPGLDDSATTGAGWMAVPAAPESATSSSSSRAAVPAPSAAIAVPRPAVAFIAAMLLFAASLLVLDVFFRR